MSVQIPFQIVTAEPHALALSSQPSYLVFEDPASRALLKRVQRIALSDATALIIGETCTGKELITHHVHELSDRRSSLTSPLAGSRSYVRVGPKGEPHAPQPSHRRKDYY